MFEAQPFLIVVALLLLLSLVLGLLRALRGPTLEDRILSVQLLGTGGVALLMVLATILRQPALLDVGLVLALLAAVAAIALTRKEASDD